MKLDVDKMKNAKKWELFSCVEARSRQQKVNKY